MNEKERRLFIDEIIMLGEQKEFKVSSYAIKRSLNVMLNPFAKWGKGAIENMRKAYNYTFVGICDKHRVENTAEIYTSLDRIWNEFGLDKGPQVVLRVLWPVRIAEIAGAWNNYIKKTRDLAKTITIEKPTERNITMESTANYLPVMKKSVVKKPEKKTVVVKKNNINKIPTKKSTTKSSSSKKVDANIIVTKKPSTKKSMTNNSSSEKAVAKKTMSKKISTKKPSKRS